MNDAANQHLEAMGSYIWPTKNSPEVLNLFWKGVWKILALVKSKKT